MIGTLHGYCLRLLREHFHELGLDPALHTLDEAETYQLQEQSLAMLWETAYTGTDSFSLAVRNLWSSHFNADPRAAGSALTQLHAAVRALEDPTGWLLRQDAYWSNPEPETWRRELLAELSGWATAWLIRLGGATNNPAAATNPNLARRLPWLIALTQSPPESADRTTVADALSQLCEQPGEVWLPRQKTKLRAPLINLFAEAAAWSGWLTPGAEGTDPLREDWDWSRVHMQTLLELWRRFETDFARRKRDRAAVDFADQEQFALELLGRGDAVGSTRVAAGERHRFACVLVDECQDLNAAQDAILRAVSRHPNPGDPALPVSGNRFLVGDVKQSIYRFRRADPTIFQRYAQAWANPGAGGRVLALNENFRSAESVLAFVNQIFPWLLRPEFGGVAFGPDAALQFGSPTTRAALAGTTARVEVHLRITGEAEADETAAETEEEATNEISKMEREAGLVAARLRELHESQYPVWDKHLQQLRPVRWSDMAVLLRGKQSRAEDFSEAFAAQGVPLQTGAGDFFGRPEIRDLKNLVAILDNPLQDVPLVGVLRSPFVGLTEADQLAAIRMVRRRGEVAANQPPEQWWTLLQHFIEIGRDQLQSQIDPTPPPLFDETGRAVLSGATVFIHPNTASAARAAWVRADGFRQRFAIWRQKAARGPVSLALEAALDDTGFEAAWRSQPEGATANANIQKFLDLARQFDQRRTGGPAGFLRWLDGQRAAEAIPSALAGGTETVTLLTIHKSKGLEFPVVAVAALGATFNVRDAAGAEWILDANLELAPRIHPPDGRSYPGPTLWLAQRRQRREQWGEEMRLLYVALTRAADRLLLFGTTTAKKLEGWQATEGPAVAPLSVATLESARCPLDWLGLALVRGHRVDWSAGGVGSMPLFTWQIWTEAETVTAPTAAIPCAQIEPDGDAVTVRSLPTYPHQAATREPAKATVTGLRKRRQLETEEESGRLTIGWSNRGASHVAEDDEVHLDGSAPADVSAVERGLLHHRFMELVDLAQTESAASLTLESERLVREGRFTATEAASLDAPAIARFWSGPLGAVIRQHPADVRRELPFTLRLSIADLARLGFHPDPGLAAEEFVVVQGVIDLVCFAGPSAWLLDFKTDRLPSATAASAKAAAYTPQLALYALAVERLFQRRVAAGWLHFLATGAEINVLAREA